MKSSTRQAISFFHRLEIKLMLVLITVLVIVFGAIFYLITKQQHDDAMQQASAESEAVAHTLLASLQTLMLAGDGTLAADWLQRVRAESSVEDVDVFRINGTQAFHDLSTIEQVNHYLNINAFTRDELPTTNLSPIIATNSFKKASLGTPSSEQQQQRLTYLLPITKDQRCETCHGYDASPIRGVLQVSISTSSAIKRLENMQKQVLLWLLLSMFILGFGVFFYIRKHIIMPLIEMTKLSNHIAQQDFEGELNVQGNDEIAALARSFNAMSDQLQHTTVSKDYVDNIIESLGEMLLVTNEQGNIVTANRAVYHLLGYNKDELLGLPASSLISKNLGKLTEKEEAIMQSDEHIDSLEVSFRSKSGKHIPVYLTISRLQEHGSGEFKMVCAARDMTRQKKADRALRLAAKVMDTVSNAIMVVDENIEIRLANPAFTRITGYTFDEVIGKNPNILKSGKQDKDFYQGMWKSIAEQGFWQGEIWNKRKDGSIYPEWLIITTMKDDTDRITHYVSSFLDITERKEFEQKLEHLANHDILTGLPNRLLFINRLQHALHACQRSKSKVALIFIDIDGFKLINDTHGHNVGDDLLKQIAQRLKQSIRNSDTVARVGGDEFVMIIEDISDIDIAINIANKALKKMCKAFELGDLTCTVGASLGISIFPDDSQNVDELSKLADTAMYYAKTSGRNRIVIYHELSEKQPFENCGTGSPLSAGQSH